MTCGSNTLPLMLLCLDRNSDRYPTVTSERMQRVNLPTREDEGDAVQAAWRLP